MFTEEEKAVVIDDNNAIVGRVRTTLGEFQAKHPTIVRFHCRTVGEAVRALQTMPADTPLVGSYEAYWLGNGWQIYTARNHSDAMAVLRKVGSTTGTTAERKFAEMLPLDNGVAVTGLLGDGDFLNPETIRARAD